MARKKSRERSATSDGTFVTVDLGRIVEISLLRKPKVEFLKHADEQMKLRGISEDDVLRTIRGPQQKGLPTQGSRERVRRFCGTKRAIDVVYERLPDRVRVITAILVTLE